MKKSVQTQLTNTFVFGSGLNLDAVRVKAQQPKELHPITDGQFEVYKGQGKNGPYTKITVAGFDAITGQAIKYELPQRYEAQADMEFCVAIDPWTKYAKDEAGNKIGNGYQHANGIRECSKEELVQFCLAWVAGKDKDTNEVPVI